MEPGTFGEPVKEEAVEEKVEAKSFFARLGGVYFSPREAFTEIGHAPRLVIPIIALVLISVFSGWYLAQKIDTRAAMRTQMEQAVKQGRITEEQMDQQIALVAAVAGPLIAVVSGVSTLALCLIVAGYGKLFSIIGGSENGFKSLLAVSVYAMLAISVVTAVLLIIILQIKGRGYMGAADLSSVIASNLGSWIESVAGADVLPKFIMGLAKAVDIFNIWIISLLSIGFSAVSKKLKTSTAAVWLGGAYVIFSIINAAVRSVTGA